MPKYNEDDIRLQPQLDVLGSMSDVVQESLALLLPVERAWQPSDYLPDLSKEDWRERLESFRGPARELSDELLVVLVGDMVTEEALPNYAISLNLIARDYSGTSQEPWARWMRGWTSEENRHGDLLNAYLRLTGRVDMRSVEVSIHNLINGGFNPKAYPDLYAGLIYTAFQERATKISHARVGTLAASLGDETLGTICKKIAGDESRHESFYTKMMGEVLKRDPERGVLVFKDMMKRIIAMPGLKMNDGASPDLFERFATVAQRTGVYTAHDYAAIFKHLMNTWQIGALQLTGEAAAAQEFLGKQVERLTNMAPDITERALEEPAGKFSWIYNRTP